MPFRCSALVLIFSYDDSRLLSPSISDTRRAVGARRWINWPFSSGPDDGFTSDLINFTASRHSQRVAGSDSQGVRVQMYYTTRELSNRAAEMPVLRSVRPNT